MAGPLGISSLNGAFYGMQAAGLLGAFIMLLTATIWHKIARRHSSWFSFMVAWLISCTSYLLTIGVPPDVQPSRGLCLLQASLVYSVPTLTAGATVALVVNVYFTLRTLLTASPNHSPMTVTAALIVVPYVPAWGVFTLSLKLGLSDPGVVQRHQDDAYCSFTGLAAPSRVSAALVATLMTICLGIEIVIIRAMRRAWETLQRDDDRGSITITVRVLAFTLVGMLSIILSLVLLALPYDHDTAFNIVIATIPLSSVIIFGTQKDILTAWSSLYYFMVRRGRRLEHGADTWETLTPTESQQTLNPYYSSPRRPPHARISRIAR